MNVSLFQCMFVIWLGAFISLGIALFGGVLWEMTTVSQALGYMTGLLECSYEFPLFKGLSPSEIAIWEAYTISFLILAYGTIAGYVSFYIFSNSFMIYRVLVKFLLKVM